MITRMKTEKPWNTECSGLSGNKTEHFTASAVERIKELDTS